MKKMKHVQCEGGQRRVGRERWRYAIRMKKVDTEENVKQEKRQQFKEEMEGRIGEGWRKNDRQRPGSKTGGRGEKRRGWRKKAMQSVKRRKKAM